MTNGGNLNRWERESNPARTSISRSCLTASCRCSAEGRVPLRIDKRVVAAPTDWLVDLHGAGQRQRRQTLLEAVRFSRSMYACQIPYLLWRCARRSRNLIFEMGVGSMQPEAVIIVGGLHRVLR